MKRDPFLDPEFGDVFEYTVGGPFLGSMSMFLGADDSGNWRGLELNGNEALRTRGEPALNRKAWAFLGNAKPWPDADTRGEF